MMDNMSDTTNTNYIRQIGSYKLPSDIDTPNTEIYYYYGTKITNCWQRKQQNILGTIILTLK